MELINNANPIFVISGPSASGKGSVWSPLRDKENDVCISISHTTRPPREGEIHGRDYHFVTEEIFDQILKSDDFVEWERVHEHRYGTRKSDFLALVNSGKKIIIEIDVNGAENLKKIFSKVVTIFIMPPDIKTAEKRLRRRNSESPDSMKIRIKRYEMELEKAKMYDHIIINDNLEIARKKLVSVINKY